MRNSFRIHLICVSTMAFGAVVVALGDDGVEPTVDSIRSAVAKSLPLLEKASKVSIEKRKECFTCHNVGLPVLALTTAQKRGFEIDSANLRRQVEFTAEFLAKNRAEYLEGRGQGGQIDTAGYALWTLSHGEWPADETTAAVAEYLLIFQKELDYWKPQSRRPPTEQSHFTSTHVALRGLKNFGTPALRERIDHRFEEVRQWLIRTPAHDTEDRVSRLRALEVSSASADELARAAEELSGTQRADGGWGQLDDLSSDPYATGSALVALHQSAGLATNDPAYRRGLRYLIANQLDDGSWHVTTRSKPIQTYYESGYPHGDDQFISISAAGWATTALALALPLETKSASLTPARDGSTERGD